MYAAADASYFLKQYGDVRTGTNALRNLVMLNFPRTTVLMHVLGGKHEPPADLYNIAVSAHNAVDADREFVRQATLSTPADWIDFNDPEQAQFVDRVATPLGRCMRGGRFGFLVSVRGPYAWADSWIRLRSRVRALPPPSFAEVRRACARTSALQRHYLSLADGPFPTTVVRCEDLAAGPEEVLNVISEQHGITRGPYRAIGRPLMSVWDHQGIPVPGPPFDPTPYFEHLHVERLGDALLEVVTEAVDWEIAGRFGYAPLNT